MILSIALLLCSLQEPTFPGAEWAVLAPEQVETAAEFERFEDAFTSEDLQAWRAAPLAIRYDVGSEPPRDLTAAHLLDLLRSVRARLEASESFSQHNGPLLRSLLLTELHGLSARMPAPRLDETGTGLPLDWTDSRSFVDDRFQVKAHTWDREGARLHSDAILFLGLPSQIVLRVDELPPPGTLGPSEPHAYFATLDQAIELRAVAARVVQIFGILSQAQLELTAERLSEIQRGWSNYLERGYSQYPWESWLNAAWTDFSWSRPPRSQWILLHPELGLVFDTRSSRSAEWQSTLLVHAIGGVRYFGAERNWFAGLSASASITDDSRYGLGFGPTLHFGHSGLQGRFPHISLSLLWHDFEDGGTEPVLAASIDLLRLLEQGQEPRFRSVLSR